MCIHAHKHIQIKGIFPDILQSTCLNLSSVLQLDIVGQNYISPDKLEIQVPVTEVEQAAFDDKGSWLLTFERWDDGVMTPEYRLKFWFYNREKQKYLYHNLFFFIMHNWKTNNRYQFSVIKKKASDAFALKFVVIFGFYVWYIMYVYTSISNALFLFGLSSYQLSTTIESPHKKRVVSVQFRPQSPSEGHMAVTSSEDGTFKLWRLVNKPQINSMHLFCY